MSKLLSCLKYNLLFAMATNESLRAIPLSDVTEFQTHLLLAIDSLGDEPHGLGIKERVGTMRDEEINHGRLYPNLDTLVKKGLVQKGQIDRRTNSYTLTARARRELSEWVGYLNERVEA